MSNNYVSLLDASRFGIGCSREIRCQSGIQAKRENREQALKAGSVTSPAAPAAHWV